MFERFTEAARQVVVLAAAEARLLKHDYIGIEHILLGLLREEDGLGARVLASLGLTVELARAELVSLVGLGAAPFGASQPFTAGAKKALEFARDEADALDDECVTPQHLLLGLLQGDEGFVARLLREVGAKPRQMRDYVLAGDGGGSEEGRTREAESGRPRFPERFTDRAERVVVLAEIEARLLRHDHVGTEHLLLGLLWEGENCACRALTSLGITRERVRDHVMRIASATEAPAGSIPLTEDANRASDLARDAAASLGHDYTAPEHLLLGLAREVGCVGTRILVDFGAGPDQIRDELMRMLSGPGSETGGRAEGSEQAREFELRFEDSNAVRCSFCGERGRLIGSCLPGAEDTWICEACVEVFPRVVSMRREHEVDEEPREEEGAGAT